MRPRKKWTIRFIGLSLLIIGGLGIALVNELNLWQQSSATSLLTDQTETSVGDIQLISDSFDEKEPESSDPSLENVNSSAINISTGESIQEAINNAPGGSLIQLGIGTYKVNLKITKEVTIQGRGPDKTILLARYGEKPVLWINPKDKQNISVRLEGMTISGAHTDPEVLDHSRSIHGIVAGRNSTVEVIHSRVQGNSKGGISVQEDAELKVIDSEILDNRSFGVWAGESARAEILHSTISDNSGFGLMVEDRAQIRLTNSKVSDSRESCLETHGDGTLKVVKSTISQCDYGIWAGGSSKVSVSGSTINRHRKDGIAILYSAHVLLEKSKISQNEGYGISFFMHTIEKTDTAFTDHLSGQENIIPGPAEPEGNLGGSIQPKELETSMFKAKVRESKQESQNDQSATEYPFLNSGLEYEVTDRAEALGKDYLPATITGIVQVRIKKGSALNTRFGYQIHTFWVQEITTEKLHLMEYYILSQIFLRNFVFKTNYSGSALLPKELPSLGARLHYGWLQLREIKYPKEVIPIHQNYLEATKPATRYLGGGIPNSTMTVRALSQYGPGGLRAYGYRSSYAIKLICDATSSLIKLLNKNGIEPY